jgi:hypothetical protein
MQEIVDAVPPHRAPAVGAEQLFDRSLGLAATERERALVDQERHRVVRHEAIVGEVDRSWFDIGADHGHGLQTIHSKTVPTGS